MKHIRKSVKPFIFLQKQSEPTKRQRTPICRDDWQVALSVEIKGFPLLRRRISLVHQRRRSNLRHPSPEECYVRHQKHCTRKRRCGQLCDWLVARIGICKGTPHAIVRYILTPAVSYATYLIPYTYCRTQSLCLWELVHKLSKRELGRNGGVCAIEL